MNYQRIYDEFIADRLKKQPEKGFMCEEHHILPISLGGSNFKSNLIRLSYSDHLFAHELLARIYRKTEHAYKMWGALLVMSRNAARRKKAGSGLFRGVSYKKMRRLYEISKKEMVEAQSGENSHGADKNLYTFVNVDGRSEKLTRQAFMKKNAIFAGAVRRILDGEKFPSACGWSAPNVQDPSSSEYMEYTIFSMEKNAKKFKFINMLGSSKRMTMASLRRMTGMSWCDIRSIVIDGKAKNGWCLME